MPDPHRYFENCPVCGQVRLVSRLKSPGHGNYLLVETGSQTRQFQQLDVRVWLCPVCGHMDLQARLPYLPDDPT